MYALLAICEWIPPMDSSYKRPAMRKVLQFHDHGGTTEEGNCSYLLPREAVAGSNGTNKGHIRKVPVGEIVLFFGV